MKSYVNTKKIGDRFENKSLDIIQQLIEEEQLGVIKEYIRIYRQKEYYSERRKNFIKFDLTIEVWPPGADRYVMLYLIECKNYTNRVPVSRIEEFHDKITQVSGVNVKAIFISNSPLQKGGYNIAESIGMMVIQGESSDDYKIILHKRSHSELCDKIPIVKVTINQSLIDAGIEGLEKIVDKKIIAAFQVLSSDSWVSYGIEKLNKEEIEKIANDELNTIKPKVLTDAYSLDVDILIKYLKDIYKVNIYYELNNSNHLASCHIKEKNICINKSIQGTNRELFILGHEFGHFLLHQRLSIGQNLYDLFEDFEYNFRIGRRVLNNPKHWIEWQANYFASTLIMPKATFLARVWRFQDLLNMKRGKIYIDDQYETVKVFSELITRLAYFFNVTKTSIIYKLKEMKLINDNSRIKSIGQIITEFREGLLI